MFLYRQTNTGLSAGYIAFCCQICHTGVVQITFHLYPQTFQGSPTDAGHSHRHIRYNRAYLPGLYQGMKMFHRIRIGMEQLLHFKIGRRMDGMKQGPFMSKGNIPVMQLPLDCPKAFYHDALAELRPVVGLRRIVTAGRHHAGIGQISL